MADNFDNYSMKVQARVDLPSNKDIDAQIRKLEKSISKLKVSGQFDDTALRNLTNQLNTLKANITTANFSPTALTELTNQVNRALQNINIGNINVGGVGNQAQQAGQQLGQQISQGVAQGINNNEQILNSFRNSLQRINSSNTTIAMDNSQIENVVQDVENLGLRLESVKESMSTINGRRGARNVLSVAITGVDELGQAVSLTRQYNANTGELTRSVDALSSATQKANTQLENLSAQQISKQQSLRNQLKQIYESAKNPNADRSITNKANLDKIEDQYTNITNRINDMRRSSKVAFAEQEAEISGLITSLKTSVKNYRDMENVRTSLKPDKLAEGISKAQSRWKSLETQINNANLNFEDKNLQKLNEQITNIRNNIKTIESGGILNKSEVESLHTTLTNAKHELDAIVQMKTSNSSLEAIRLQADTLKNKLDEFAKKNTGFADWTREVNNTTVSVETLKTELDNVRTASDLRVATARVNEFESAFKAANATVKNTNVDKLNADVQKLSSDLNTFASKNAGFDTFKTDINGVEVSLDSLIQKLSTVDNNTDLSTIRSQANALKSAFTELQEVNKIQLLSNGGVKNDYATQIAKLEGNFRSLGLAQDTINQKTQNVKNSLATLRAEFAKPVDQQNFQAIQTANDNLQRELVESRNEFEQLRASMKGMATEQQRLSLANTIEAWNQKNTAATKAVREENERYVSSLRDLSNQMTRIDFNKINTGFKQNENSMRTLHKLGASLKDQLKQAASSFTQWVSVSSAIMAVIYQLQKMPQKVKELDDAITDFTMATGANKAQISELTKVYSKLGDELSATVTDVTISATEWLKQGKSIAETETLIRDAMVLSKVGKLSSEESTKYLTSAMKGYNVTAEETLAIVDKLSAVDMASATDVGGLAEGMSEVANNANLAGISMDKLLGYLATIGEVTQSSMSEVGTSLNAIFSRMGNIKLSRLKDYQNNGEDLSNVETVLRGEGIALRDSADDFRNFGEVLDEVAGRWNSFSEVSQRAIASAFAGTNHMEDFLVLMSNYDTALGYTETSLNSYGQAMEKFEAYEESLTGKLEKLENAFIKLSNTVLDSGLLKGLVDLGTTGVKAIDGLVNALTPLGTIGLLGGAGLGIKNAG